VHELGQLREQLTANSLGERRVEDGNEVVGLLRNVLADIDRTPVSLSIQCASPFTTLLSRMI
jgi:hypothetical protein